LVFGIACPTDIQPVPAARGFQQENLPGIDTVAVHVAERYGRPPVAVIPAPDAAPMRCPHEVVAERPDRHRTKFVVARLALLGRPGAFPDFIALAPEDLHVELFLAVADKAGNVHIRACEIRCGIEQFEQVLVAWHKTRFVGQKSSAIGC
jgi:hypothetical protein